jgi:hypothetical protein
LYAAVAKLFLGVQGDKLKYIPPKPPIAWVGSVPAAQLKACKPFIKKHAKRETCDDMKEIL